MDFYDVSFVDGFNVPLVVMSVNVQGNYNVVGVMGICLNELAVKVNRKILACRRTCDVFNMDTYCRRVVFRNATMC